ncbi:MAG: hypothetical protein IPI73_18885 [Betaproteobacteria bacterium]|nr:hypothetical protein [Betaproteobacteria bacterium]
MTFRLYDAESGGAPIWTETQPSVNVENGVFSAILGAVTPLTLPFDIPYWLTVAINADGEMSPRRMVNSSPYALRSANADTLSLTANIAGSQITGSITSGTIPGSQVTGSIAGSQITGTISNSILPGTLPGSWYRGAPASRPEHCYLFTGATPTTIPCPIPSSW